MNANVTAALPVVRRKRRLLRWIGYLAKSTALLLIVVAGIGAAYEAIGTHADHQLHAPGRLVDVGGYRLHIDCSGSGVPAVILEAGGGNPGLAWYRVQPQVAQFTRVCSYDRGGLGWSDPSPKPRTAKVIAEEVHTLLQNACESGPFVMVGHSLGGMDVRMYAAQYPAEVAGMVLVDSSHPDQEERFPPEAKKLSAATDYVARFMQITLPFGVPRLLAGRAAPADVRREFCAEFCQRKSLAAVRGEIAAETENSAEVRALGSLGNVPLAVLSHDPEKVRFPGNLTEPVNRAWAEMQNELSHLSSDNSMQVVKGAGHDIQLDKPEIVTAAIHNVVEKVRSAHIRIP